MIDAERLLDGPRGRELCLRVAMHAEGRDLPADADEAMSPLGTAVFFLDVGRPGSTYFAYVEGDRTTAPWRVDPQRTEPDDVYVALSRLPVTTVDVDVLPSLLSEVVGSARYWQEADRRDAILAQPRFRDALAPWARLIAACPEARWWDSPIDREGQVRLVAAERAVPHEGVTTVREGLARAAEGIRQSEEAARRELRSRRGRVASGAWWSIPMVPAHTTRRWPQGRVPDESNDLPAGPDGRVHDGLGGLLEEDAHYDPHEATWQPVPVPRAARVLEIDSPQVWIDLCREAPIDVTASNWATWADWTGRQAPWVIPDWSRVAERWDGVHLSLAAYLEFAGRTLPVSGEWASVMAGWAPDETYWFIEGMDGMDDAASVG